MCHIDSGFVSTPPVFRWSASREKKEAQSSGGSDDSEDSDAGKGSVKNAKAKKSKKKKGAKKRRRGKGKKDSSSDEDDQANELGAPVQKKQKGEKQQPGYKEMQELVVRTDGEGTEGPRRVFTLDCKYLR